MKLAVVVQRYGESISGGAELHARYVAEHLARHADVEVLTTCATDYVTWRNELASGVERVNGVAVRRFPRRRYEHDPAAARHAGRSDPGVQGRVHSIADELDWLDAEGPASPALIAHLRKHGSSYDYCLFFSYRYYHAYHGARADGAAARFSCRLRSATRRSDLSIFAPVLRGVRALMYNSHEERAMIQRGVGQHRTSLASSSASARTPMPNTNPQPARFRQKIRHIREAVSPSTSAGSARTRATRNAVRFLSGLPARCLGPPLRSSSSGTRCCRCRAHPAHPPSRFLDDADKFDAMAAADALIMPIVHFESLSMVALQALGARSRSRCSANAKRGGNATCCEGQCASATTRGCTTNRTASSSKSLAVRSSSNR